MTARSISPASPTSTGRNSTPNDGAAPWITANWPIPEDMAASRRTATRVTLGAMVLPAGPLTVKSRYDRVPCLPRNSL